MELFIFGLGKLLLIAALIVANAFFVAAEFALVRVRPASLESLARQGSRRAKLALHVLAHLDAYLSACQVGVTLASVLIGWLGEPTVRVLIVDPLFNAFQLKNDVAARLLSFFLGTGAVASILIVIGEQAPKYIALRRAELATLLVVYPLHWFYVFMKPVIHGLDLAADSVCQFLGVPRSDATEEAHSEDELRYLLVASCRRGKLPEDTLDLLENIMELPARTVRQVMVPRTEIAFLTIQKSLAENLKIAEKTAHSRYPLVDGDLDNVIGIVHTKDLLWQLQDLETILTGGPLPERNPAIKGDMNTGVPASGAEFLRKIVRKTFFVPETMHLDALLREFQKKRSHMAIVVDEYGGVAGLVTLENVIEAIVGQIQDEFDAEKPRIEKIGEREFIVDGVTPITEANHVLGTSFESEEVDTIGGLILKEFERLPEVGESVLIDGVELKVAEMDKQRIARVLVRLPEEKSEEVEPEREGEEREEDSSTSRSIRSTPEEEE